MDYTINDILNVIFEVFGVDEKDQEMIHKAIKDGKYIHTLKFTYSTLEFKFPYICSVNQLTKTRFVFRGIMPLLHRICNTNILYVEMDRLREESLDNMVRRNHKLRYDYFEFETYTQCLIAYD